MGPGKIAERIQLNSQFSPFLTLNITQHKLVTVVRQCDHVAAIGRPTRTEESLRALQLRNPVSVNVEQFDGCGIRTQAPTSKGKRIPIR